MQSDRDARIRERAYQIWVSEGRRHGLHEAHWQQAEREIEAEEAAGGTKSPTRPARARAKPPVTSEASPVTVSKAEARDGLKATAARAHLVLRLLDAQVKSALVDDPKALAGWNSAKRIGRGKVVPVQATPPAQAIELKAA